MNLLEYTPRKIELACKVCSDPTSWQCAFCDAPMCKPCARLDLCVCSKRYVLLVDRQAADHDQFVWTTHVVPNCWAGTSPEERETSTITTACGITAPSEDGMLEHVPPPNNRCELCFAGEALEPASEAEGWGVASVTVEIERPAGPRKTHRGTGAERALTPWWAHENQSSVHDQSFRLSAQPTPPEVIARDRAYLGPYVAARYQRQYTAIESVMTRYALAEMATLLASSREQRERAGIEASDLAAKLDALQIAQAEQWAAYLAYVV